MEPEFRNIIPELFREWKREDSQNRLWNETHQEEGNEVDLNSVGRKGFEDWWGEKGLVEEDRNDRDEWRKKIL
jgi:hypothetical protein